MGQPCAPTEAEELARLQGYVAQGAKAFLWAEFRPGFDERRVSRGVWMDSSPEIPKRHFFYIRHVMPKTFSIFRKK